ncbi:MAG: glycosyltransferase [Bacteroidetes bacterium]|nr:glycosyltransferase [Bacteroidota bacterium]
MKAPAVSVVIPLYNSAAFIGETIRSVLQQHFSELELIVVDDGSTDDSANVVKKINDSRLKYFHQKNKGVSAARNYGIKNASGKFIALLDADDVMLPENISRKVKTLETHPEADFAFSDVRIISNDKNENEMILHGKNKDLLNELLLWESDVIPNSCSNLVFRKNISDKGIQFDETLSTAADQDFSIQLAAKYEGIHLPEVLSLYRKHAGGMSRNISVMEKDHIAVYNKTRMENLFTSTSFRRKCFSNLYLVLAGSWWVNGGNKRRALRFMFLAVFTRPLSFFKLLKKIF